MKARAILLTSGGLLLAGLGAAVLAARPRRLTTTSTAPLGNDNLLHLGDRDVPIIFTAEIPSILLTSSFLTEDECSTLIELARPRLERSMVISPVDGASVVHGARSSEGASLPRGAAPAIEARLAALTGSPVEHGEGLQILRYLPGEEYRAHVDYFSDAAGDRLQLARGGQRVATVLLYLNDVEAGGHTAFPEASLSVAPVKGSALLFRYLDASNRPDPRSLHAGLPVERGEKWVAAWWVRQGRYSA